MPRMTAEQFADAQTEAVCHLPPEFRATLCGMAWESGHSAGYEEVIGHLRELASELRRPIEQYAARLRQESAPGHWPNV